MYDQNIKRHSPWAFITNPYFSLLKFLHIREIILLPTKKKT